MIGERGEGGGDGCSFRIYVFVHNINIESIMKYKMYDKM